MARKPKVINKRQTPREKRSCPHYWIIEAPQGPTSIGRCQYCGTISEFKNYIPFPTWENRTSRYDNRKDTPESEDDVGF